MAHLPPLLESILNAALKVRWMHIRQKKNVRWDNRRNGKMQKLVHTPLDDVTVSTPRNHNLSFDPQFIKRREPF